MPVDVEVITDRLCGWRGDFFSWDIPKELEYLADSNLVRRSFLKNKITITAAGRDALDALRKEMA